MITNEQNHALAVIDHHLSFLKERLRRMERFRNLKTRLEWIALKEDIEASIKTASARKELIESDSRMENSEKAMLELRLWAGQIVGFKAVIADVECADEKIAAINDEIEDFNSRARQHRDGTQKPTTRRAIA